MSKRSAAIITAIVLFGLTAGWVLTSDRYQQWLAERRKQNLPPAENANVNISTANTNSTTIVNDSNANFTDVLPANKNLAVPFTSQAPHANWDQDHNEFCEEASVLMVGRFWKELPISNPDDAEAALQRIKAWELDNLGFYYDTTAAETAAILAGLYNLKTKLLENPTVAEIKAEIAAGRPVIVPAAGRELGNPNYTPPGPIYHMIVIKGYTDDGQFITNDPGTRRGADFVFDQDVVIKAMHDWAPAADRTKPRNGDSTGRKVVIVAEPT